jgi:uncharacterized protein (DUF488 family)
MRQLSFDVDTQRSVLFTIGYQGRDLAAFVRLLMDRGVRTVVDVREHPTSRRPGFAKSPLSAAVTEAGIAYVHIREAGNPFRHEEGTVEEILALYAAHLDAHPAIVERVVAAVRPATSVLLCFERNPRDCHRTPLAERVSPSLKLSVVAL